ncbi:MAG: hypothetical protein ACAH95_13675 [Fimbriimonas sp.]
MLALLIVPTIAFQEIVWAPSPQIARAYAQKTGKPLMLVSRRLDPGRNFLDRCFDDSRVIELSRKFVCYRANSPTELSQFGKLPSNLVKVEMMPPPVIFVEPSGRFISRMGAFYWPSAFAEYLRQALWVRSSSAAIQKELSKERPEGKYLAQWAVVKAVQCELKSAELYCERAIARGAPERELAAALQAIADAYRAEGQFKESLVPLRRSLTYADSPADVFKARIRLGSSYLRLGDIEKAEAEALRCIRMDGIRAEDREIAEFQLDRLKFMKPLPEKRKLEER